MIRRLIGSILGDILPKNRKRQIFLASFAAILKGVTTYDRETYKKLDRVLSLSESNEEALAVPVMLSKVIWNGKTTYAICGDDVSTGDLTTDRVTKVVGNILNSMPSWLLYGTTEEIEKDVSILLNDRRELLGA